MRTIRSVKRRQIVLAAISRGLTVAEAAAQAGISRRSIFDWRDADIEFARDYEQAYSAGTDCYEAEARRRAFGESDALLIFLLKSRDPVRFNRRMLAIGGDPNAPPVMTSEVSAAWLYPRVELQRQAVITAEAGVGECEDTEEDAA